MREARNLAVFRVKSRAALIALALGLLSCLGGDPDPGGETAGPTAAEERERAAGTGEMASTPFDLSAVVRQVESAFRPDGRAYVAFGDAHEIRALAGKNAFVAVHCDEAACIEASFEFETAAIERGTEVIRGVAAQARVGDHGELVIEREGFEERLVNEASGVEQSWTFPRAPSGQGDLLVEVSVEGHEFAGVTAGGLHFVDPATGVGVRYGHATWIDAVGARHELPAHWDGARIELRVPAELVETSPYPAVLDPVVSPEFGIDAPARGPATRHQAAPAVAFNGTHYQVVWTDLRAGNIDIYTTRVDANGVVLDHGGLAVASGFRLKSAPAIASDGGQFLVVWSERRDGDYQIRGARIDANGSVVSSSYALANTVTYHVSASTRTEEHES